MPDSNELALWYALHRLMTDYWAEVDHNGGELAHEFYLPNALFAVGGNRFEGEDKIRAFYARRRRQSNTTRHLVDNVRIFPDESWRARIVGVMSLYRSDGRPPVLGVRAPAMIADFEARCVLGGDDQRWRFQSHLLRPIFVGSDLPASISIDPQRL
jgi:SnoaL-like domain